jgi:hypothetical protein
MRVGHFLETPSGNEDEEARWQRIRCGIRTAEIAGVLLVDKRRQRVSLESRHHPAALPENVCSLRELRTEVPQEFGDSLASGWMLVTKPWGKAWADVSFPRFINLHIFVSS